MVDRMKSVNEEFMKLPDSTKMSIPSKDRERAAELLVSVEVEVTFKISGDVLEMATAMNGMTLQEDQVFVESTQQLGDLMKELLEGAPLGNVPSEVSGGASTDNKQALHNPDTTSPNTNSPAGTSNTSAALCVVGISIVFLFGAVMF